MTELSEFNGIFTGSSQKSLALENKAIYLQWKKFINGDTDLDTTITSQETLNEWRHCKALKIDPFKKLNNIALAGNALKEKLHQNEAFINISQPFIHKLFRFMKDFSYAVGLFDRDGYLLKVITEEKFRNNNMMFNFFIGTRWTEKDAGNSCASHILDKKRPKQVIGANHYLKIFHLIAASGAPITAPDGELLGGIIVTTFYSATHPHTLGMAMAAAHAIENEWRAQKALIQCQAAFEQTDIASGLQKAIISSIPEGLIAIDPAGRITSLNEHARSMFGFNPANLTEMTLQNIFSREENRSFWDMIEQQDSISDTEVRIRTSRGVSDYSLTFNNILLSSGAVIGKILIFAENRRIKSIVTKVIGAKANFTFNDLGYQNEHFKNIIDQACMISQSASNVLLLGESGTGKDILAQAIHNASPRKEGPYVAINCAAIPRDLIASELFGYSEGAFTGSKRGGNQGKFELADGGTIFLDEIAETPLEIQAVLLRVIEDKCVVRVGSSQIRSVDVRIISATNRDLPTQISKGNFRHDLYYRLNVFNVQLPPLRERTDDIPLLVERFIRKYATALGKTIDGTDEKVLDLLMSYRWPGNVRELQNVVERMVNYASGNRLTVDLIPPEIIDTRRTGRRSLDFEPPEEAEQRLIRHLLSLKFRKNKIAEQLNMSRANFYRKLKKYGLLKRNDR